jgi:tetratricopeptide (TPR) repeat protein
MFRLDKVLKNDSSTWDFDFEFWPSQADSFLKDKDYQRAADICEANLAETGDLLSGRLIYAIALYHLKEIDRAADQFYTVLTKDPDNLTALKYLGDIHYNQEDVVTAMASYSRVLELDPYTRGLRCELTLAKATEKTSIKILRPPETKQTVCQLATDSPFMTETMGNLYLKQGQLKLALEIFRELSKREDNPHFKQRLAEVEEFVSRKEKENVS